MGVQLGSVYLSLLMKLYFGVEKGYKICWD